MTNEFQPESKQSLRDFMQALGRDRDRLRVQVNLAEKEVRDEWEELEVKWKHLEKTVSDAGADTRHLVQDVGRELKDAYKKLESYVLD